MKEGKLERLKGELSVLRVWFLTASGILLALITFLLNNYNKISLGVGCLAFASITILCGILRTINKTMKKEVF